MADFQCIPITFNHFFVLFVFPFPLVAFSFIITFLQANHPIESKPVGLHYLGIKYLNHFQTPPRDSRLESCLWSN